VSRFSVTDTPLAGLRIVERKRMGDERGFLSRVFCAEELRPAGWIRPIAQINHTFTARLGTVRGMHFQSPPFAEMKLVSCLGGEVWDVAIDLRRDSSTFLKWHGERLSAENGRALLIPEGFAHGFQALSDGAVLLYCHSAPYVPQAEGGLNPRDPSLAIGWPLAIAEMSTRDAGQPAVDSAFEGLAP
jgi:dTDP-4-dehydrorhamnose 3,5-epimerase